MKVIVIWLITAVAIAAAIWLVPGVSIAGSDSMLQLILLAGILALLNAFIKPILQVVSLPITCLTLGVFALVINTVVLYLTAWLGSELFQTGLILDNFASALLASIVVSIATAVLNAITGVKDKNASSS